MILSIPFLNLASLVIVLGCRPGEHVHFHFRREEITEEWKLFPVLFVKSDLSRHGKSPSLSILLIPKKEARDGLGIEKNVVGWKGESR